MTLIAEVLDELETAGFPSVTIELIKPTMIDDPNEDGRQIESWTNPTVITSVRGNIQPASTQALQRAGMLGKVNTKQIYSEEFGAMPESRVRVGEAIYIVRSVRPWQGHTEVLVEEL